MKNKTQATSANKQFKHHQKLVDLFISRISGKLRNESMYVDTYSTIDVIRAGLHGKMILDIKKYIPDAILCAVLVKNVSGFDLVYKKRLTRLQTDGLYELSLIWAELNEHFESDHLAIRKWIAGPEVLLEEMTPADLMDAGIGRQKIRDCIKLLRFGDVS